MNGLIHIYTGEGKGKSTAAMGLALRAAGHGQNVVIVQFLKGSETGEISVLRKIPEITLLRNAQDYGFFGFQDEKRQAEMIREHDANLGAALRCVHDGLCGLLILDEAIAAYNLNALNRGMLDALLLEKPEGLELVLTGREPPPHFIEAADYVSDIKKEKHPFDRGVPAREGIEY